MPVWIFGSAARDFALLHLAGVLTFVFVWTVPMATPIATALGLVTLAAIDTGHMYTTVWRTWFRSAELRSSPRYWVAPLLIFLGVLAWASSGIPYLFTVLVYGTIYHHMRQYYGVVRWYEKLNRRTDRASHFFIHLLFLVPLAMAHVRPDGLDHLFYKGDVIFFPNETWFRGLTVIYGATVLAWLVHEARLWRSGVREVNRVLAIFIPMFFAGVGCALGKNGYQIILPLVWTHGIAYFGLMSLSLNRLEPKRWTSMWMASIPILLTAVFVGAGVFYLDEAYLETDYLSGLGWGNLLLIAAIQTPTVCHYLFDAWIWTGKHREAKIVYSLPATALKK